MAALMESTDFSILKSRIQKLVIKQKSNGCLSIPEGLELTRLVKHKQWRDKELFSEEQKKGFISTLKNDDEAEEMRS